jgi:hypothetical protein
MNELSNMEGNMTYKDQGTQRGIIGVRQIINDGVHRIPSLDGIIDPYRSNELL